MKAILIKSMNRIKNLMKMKKGINLLFITKFNKFKLGEQQKGKLNWE